MLEWTRKWVEVGRERDVRDGRRGIRREKRRKSPPTWTECDQVSILACFPMNDIV